MARTGVVRIVNRGNAVAEGAGNQRALCQRQVGSSLVNPSVRLPW